MIENIDDIHRIFKNPISFKQNTFTAKSWSQKEIITVAIVGGLAIYGAYTLYSVIKNKFSPEGRKKEKEEVPEKKAPKKQFSSEAEKTSENK